MTTSAVCGALIGVEILQIRAFDLLSYGHLIATKEVFETMPLYEYYCSDCRGKFEVLTSYEASQGAMLCATCHGSNVRKLLSVFARPSRGGDDGDFGEFSDGGEDFDGGGCACGGGSCGCHN